MLLLSVHKVNFGSKEHLLPIIIVVILGVVCLWFAKNKFNPLLKTQFLHKIGVFICSVVIIFHCLQLIKGNYNFSTDLPLYLCSSMALFIPFYTYKQSYKIFEILVFWVFAGTLQGIITPDIPEGFPSFDYFRYWTVHLGLVFIMLYSIVVLNYTPTVKSVFKSFFALQCYALCMFGINYLLNANYSYLNKKPDIATVLDYFGEWPN